MAYNGKDPIECAVAKLLVDTDIDGPPVDAIQIAKCLGIEVRLDASQASRGRLVRGRMQPMICVRPEPRSERWQWTVAHEIGEHLMERLSLIRALDSFAGSNFSGTGFPGSEDYPGAAEIAREETANRFANVLLVPGHWLVEDCAATGCDLLALKERYRTASYEVLALRMLDLSEPSIITIFDNGELMRRRGNLPGCLPSFQPIESRAQLQAHESGQPVKLATDGLSIQAWPIHEPHWKREILRTTLEEIDVW